MSLCRGSSGSAGRLHNTTRTAVSRSRRVVKTVIYIAVFVNAWSAALLCRVVFLAAGRSLFAPLPPEQEVQQSTGSFQDSACLHDDDCVVSVDSVGGTASVKTLDDSHGSGLAPHFGLDFIRAAALKFGGPSYAVAETESQSCVESAALDFEVSLHVFAWKRVKSLNRLLDSLLKADYDGSSRASIVFHLDGGWAEEVEQVVDSFQWLHGPKSVVKSRENLGLKRVDILSREFPESSDRPF
ncbi:hypothetical protein DFJ73DRAFT_213085 [Zopfochytrium polystomum]|nr:hypothetical protein DFJ73DRAFT_213085 [Zopfochytrium polystomum]